MTDFYVDVHGPDGLYNQLVRASQDATQTVEYTKRHCDLSITAEGFLLVMLGPHAKAYASMVTAIRKLSELAQEAARRSTPPSRTMRAPTPARQPGWTPLSRCEESGRAGRGAVAGPAGSVAAAGRDGLRRRQ
jgi:hypothetical protein